MIVFATSDKGGTGRSVTCANIAYRRALAGDDVAYVDFDFGSPTAAAVFDLASAMRGVDLQGMHTYLQGGDEAPPEPARLDVWTRTEREALRRTPPGAGRLCLVPGDRGGGEFPVSDEVVARGGELLLRLHEEFDVVLVDLSAGRSYAIEIALRASRLLEGRGPVARWLVFHRWTRQHVIATNGLVHGARGILERGAAFGHDPAVLADSIRFVRAAVPAVPGDDGGRTAVLAEWLRACDGQLNDLAADLRLGPTVRLGTVPFDPVLQWREQLITDEDVLATRIADFATWTAFDDLARALTDDARWEAL
ncbi:SCO2523 family variant P-loop protein [Actinacidiphila alni]|uniref:SCO2523 family variant P-loop protein n=1 Tax=Actinacidiphila alni TaxID=380248 RepID=UPI0033CB6694